MTTDQMPPPGEESATEGEIALYCGFQQCGQVIVQPAGRGRRKEYCSDTCRRDADRDYKRTKAHIELLEDQLRRARHQLASYGRKTETGELPPEEISRKWTEARVTLARATVVLECATSSERAQEELQALVAAFAPLIQAPKNDPAVH